MVTPLKKTIFTPFQWICVGLGALCVAAGALGLLLSFLYIASPHMADIHAGTSGFLAGAVLIAGGVVALALLSTQDRAKADGISRRTTRESSPHSVVY